MAVDKDVSLELQHAANLVIEAGVHAAVLAEAVCRGERSREYFRRLAELLDLYTSPENLVDGNPQYPLPAIVAKQLASFCHYLERWNYSGSDEALRAQRAPAWSR